MTIIFTYDFLLALLSLPPPLYPPLPSLGTLLLFHPSASPVSFYVLQVAAIFCKYVHFFSLFSQYHLLSTSTLSSLFFKIDNALLAIPVPCLPAKVEDRFPLSVLV